MKIVSTTFLNFTIGVIFLSLITFAVFIFVLFSDDEDPLRGPRMQPFEGNYPFETQVILKGPKENIVQELNNVNIDDYHFHDDQGIQTHLNI